LAEQPNISTKHGYYQCALPSGVLITAHRLVLHTSQGSSGRGVFRSHGIETSVCIHPAHPHTHITTHTRTQAHAHVCVCIYITN